MIEIITRGVRADHTRVALFDFDGTLSTIRSGWMDVMVPMMVELIGETRSGESDADLKGIVEEFVYRLTGKQTIYQMIELASQIEKRGGKPQDPLVYKHMYLDRLWTRIQDRVYELRTGACSPDKYLVPGMGRCSRVCANAATPCIWPAARTTSSYRMKRSCWTVHRYFAGVHGALDDYKSFSKAILIQRIIGSAAFAGNEFLGFGDGYVEIENVKQVGGVTVGVATDEPECLKIDDWKRTRLIGVGADVIVPNFLEHQDLFAALRN